MSLRTRVSNDFEGNGISQQNSLSQTGPKRNEKRNDGQRRSLEQNRHKTVLCETYMETGCGLTPMSRIKRLNKTKHNAPECQGSNGCQGSNAPECQDCVCMCMPGFKKGYFRLLSMIP